ncbi:MAG: hypothetical protein M0Z95_10690 [Actinomycetota bacterium]|jgi:hypothetical protein|nr:hypothetical protein [Actinomycetota bacterium]
MKDGELQELAARLENPARVQEAARSVAGDDAPNYAIEFGWLYAAVVSLNPLHAAGKIRKFAP